MKTTDIKILASELGYSITKTVKADVVAQFMEQQEQEMVGDGNAAG